MSEDKSVKLDVPRTYTQEGVQLDFSAYRNKRLASLSLKISGMRPHGRYLIEALHDGAVVAQSLPSVASAEGEFTEFTFAEPLLVEAHLGFRLRSWYPYGLGIVTFDGVETETGATIPLGVHHSGGKA